MKDLQNDDEEEEKISCELQEALKIIKTKPNKFEIGMLSREIKLESQRINRIMYISEDSEQADNPHILQRMKQDELIDREIEEKLLEDPSTPLELIEILRKTKTGHEVT